MRNYLSTGIAFLLAVTPAVVRAQAPAPQPATPPPAGAAPNPEATPTTPPQPEQPAGTTPEDTNATTPPAEAAAVAPPTAAPEAAQPPAPAPAPAPPAPAAEAAPKEPPPPKALTVAHEGLVQPFALIQAWLWFAHDNGAKPKNATTFRIRRAELGLKGTIVPDLIKYKVQIDPARALEFDRTAVPVENAPAPAAGAQPEQVTVLQPGASPGTTQSGPATIMKDAFVTVASEYVDASLGQFKIPVSYEASGSPGESLLPEFALVAKQYGDKRDIGVRLEKKFGYVGYVAEIVNGQGQNKLDTNNDKDLALRLEVYPIKWITVAGVIYNTVGDRADASAKERYEGDLKLTPGAAVILSEFIHARDFDATAKKFTDGQGAYGAVGYKIDKFLPVVRVGYLDKNTQTSDDSVVAYEGGVGYLIDENNAKVALSYGAFVPQKGTTRHEVTLAAQVMF